MERIWPEKNERLQQIIELVEKNRREWEKNLISAVKGMGLKTTQSMPRTCSKPAQLKRVA